MADNIQQTINRQGYYEKGTKRIKATFTAYEVYTYITGKGYWQLLEVVNSLEDAIVLL